MIFNNFAYQDGLYINTCRRAAEMGGPFDTRADCIKNYYFRQLQTFIALCNMAARLIQDYKDELR